MKQTLQVSHQVPGSLSTWEIFFLCPNTVDLLISGSRWWCFPRGKPFPKGTKGYNYLHQNFHLYVCLWMKWILRRYKGFAPATQEISIPMATKNSFLCGDLGLWHQHHKHTFTSFIEPEASGLERNVHIAWLSVPALHWLSTPEAIGHFLSFCQEQELTSSKVSHADFGQVLSRFFIEPNSYFLKTSFPCWWFCSLESVANCSLPAW